MFSWHRWLSDGSHNNLTSTPSRLKKSSPRVRSSRRASAAHVRTGENTHFPCTKGSTCFELGVYCVRRAFINFRGSVGDTGELHPSGAGVCGIRLCDIYYGRFFFGMNFCVARFVQRDRVTPEFMAELRPRRREIAAGVKWRN